MNYFYNNINHMKKITLLPLILAGCLFGSRAFAQSGINVTGNSATIQGMRFDYSIGEMTLVSTQKAGNIIVTQGLLQPNSAGKSSSGGNISGTAFEQLLKVYPNPSENFVFIESDEALAADFDFQLLDVSGKTIFNKENATQINPYKWKLDLSALAAGNYFIMLQQSNETNQKQQASFKIQKTN